MSDFLFRMASSIKNADADDYGNVLTKWGLNYFNSDGRFVFHFDDFQMSTNVTFPMCFVVMTGNGSTLQRCI